MYLERLRGIPFWQEARATEQRAGKMVTAFAETVSDPVLPGMRSHCRDKKKPVTVA